MHLGLAPVVAALTITRSAAAMLRLIAITAAILALVALVLAVVLGTAILAARRPGVPGFRCGLGGGLRWGGWRGLSRS